MQSQHQKCESMAEGLGTGQRKQRFERPMVSLFACGITGTEKPKGLPHPGNVEAGKRCSGDTEQGQCPFQRGRCIQKHVALDWPGIAKGESCDDALPSAGHECSGEWLLKTNGKYLSDFVLPKLRGELPGAMEAIKEGCDGRYISNLRGVN
jgi:hypothetical protein